MINTKMMVTIVAIVILGIGSIGFAGTITVSNVKPIGAGSQTVDAPSGVTVTSVDWIKGQSDGTIVIDATTIGYSHPDPGLVGATYRICAMVSNADGTKSSDLPCADRDRIAADTSDTVTLTFTNKISADVVSRTSISIEKIA